MRHARILFFVSRPFLPLWCPYGAQVRPPSLPYLVGIFLCTRRLASTQNPSGIQAAQQPPIPEGLRLYLIDSGVFKTTDMGRMLNQDSRQPLRFHAEADETLASQLSAERMVRRTETLSGSGNTRTTTFWTALCCLPLQRMRRGRPACRTTYCNCRHRPGCRTKHQGPGKRNARSF